ncbi:hypothetical protein YC2023_018365 [Brassica napus]
MSFFLGGKERTHGGQVVSRGYTCMGARWSSSQAKFVELLRQAHGIYSKKITAICIPLAKQNLQWTEKENISLEKSSRPWEKRSNNTLYVKDKQEDECGPEEVLQLVSFWNKRMWEPGGVLTDHDKWKLCFRCRWCNNDHIDQNQQR